MRFFMHDEMNAVHSALIFQHITATELEKQLSTLYSYTNPNFLAFELFKTENRNCSFCNNIDEARKWNSDYATDLLDCGMYNTPSNVQFADPIHKPEEYGRKVKK